MASTYLSSPRIGRGWCWPRSYGGYYSDMLELSHTPVFHYHHAVHQFNTKYHWKYSKLWWGHALEARPFGFTFFKCGVGIAYAGSFLHPLCLAPSVTNTEDERRPQSISLSVCPSDAYLGSFPLITDKHHCEEETRLLIIILIRIEATTMDG